MEADEIQLNSPPHSLSEEHFEAVFKSNFKALYAYAFTFVKDRDVAEDMVQSAFVKLWEQATDLKIYSSVTAYLYRSVYHECLNYLKHQKVKVSHQKQVNAIGSFYGDSPLEQLKAKELQSKIAEALAALPEGCRTIFQLSRFEGLKYREIADKLGISIKTVENQMGKSLKILRSKLDSYFLTGLVLFILSLATHFLGL